MASLYLSWAIRVMGADQKFQENHSEGGEGRSGDEGGEESLRGRAEAKPLVGMLSVGDLRSAAVLWSFVFIRQQA